MRFVSQVFTTDVTLDYNEFIDCEIRDCIVYYHGGEFSVLRTRFHNVRFAVAGAANNTLNFLKLVQANGPHLLEELLRQGEQPIPEGRSGLN